MNFERQAYWDYLGGKSSCMGWEGGVGRLLWVFFWKQNHFLLFLLVYMGNKDKYGELDHI